MKKTILTSSKLPNPYEGYYALATRAGNVVFLSLQTPTNTKTRRLVRGYDDLEANDQKKARKLATGLLTSDSREGPAIAQVWQCYSQTADFLAEHDSSIDNTLFNQLFLTDMRHYPEFTRARREFFAPRVPPPSTSAGIAALPHPDALFGFDGYAFVPDKQRQPGARMVAVNESRHVAQLRLSDYGIAGIAGPFIFVAGVVASQPEKGVFVRRLGDLGPEAEGLSTGSVLGDDFDGPMAAQTFFNLKVLQGILEENGSSWDHVLKVTIYLTDMSRLPCVERVCRSVFGRYSPAVTICGSSQQAHPDFLLETEAIAVIPGAPGAPAKEIFAHGDRFPKTGYQSGVTKAGDFFFTSPIMPYDFETGRMIAGPEDIASLPDAPPPPSTVFDQVDGRVVCQAWYVHHVLARLLEAHGASRDDVLKVNLYLRDIRDFPLVARVATQFFGDSPPAISPIQAVNLPLKDALLQMDAIFLGSS